MKAARFIVFAKDIQLITGLSLRQSQRILQQIRKKFNRKKNHLVTLYEFCSFCEFEPKDVLNALTNNL